MFGMLFLVNQVQMRQCCKKFGTGRMVASVIRPLVNDNGLQLECPMVLHELLLIPVPMYGRYQDNDMEGGEV